MSKHYLTAFNTRQYMQTEDFEIFYYEDKILAPVSTHQHDFYEIYFFLSGNVDIDLNGTTYSLSNGDICLIPPALNHKPIFKNNEQPYRRIVLWISPSYLQKLTQHYPDIQYCFVEALQRHTYHYSTDFGSTQLLFNKLIAIMEETAVSEAFHSSIIDCCISTFLFQLNRLLYNHIHASIPNDQTTLFSELCNYINTHLEESLTLDTLSARFHVSKYHIAHLFKQSMGISTHQYILRKRLYAARNILLSGSSPQEVSHTCGFGDYTSFFRAFKKEFGISPKDFKENYALTPSSHSTE